MKYGTQTNLQFLLGAKRSGQTDFYPATLAIARAENKRVMRPKAPRKKRK